MSASADNPTRPRGRPRDPGVDEDILEAALGLLTEGGFEKLSMEAVATRAGVAKATIYRRYPSKVDLIVAMCQAFAPPEQPLPGTGSLPGDLAQLIDFLNSSMCSTSESGRLMPAMISAAKENLEVREAMQRFSNSRRRRIYDIVKSAKARGELCADADPDAIGDIVVGAILYRVVLRDGKVDKRFRASLVRAVTDGFSD